MNVSLIIYRCAEIKFMIIPTIFAAVAGMKMLIRGVSVLVTKSVY
jgi:hypothetical protein